MPESKAQDDSMTKYMKSAVKENKNGHWIGYVRAMTEKGKRSDANNWESTTTGYNIIQLFFIVYFYRVSSDKLLTKPSC